MLRLNTAIAPTAGAAQNRLGVLGGDNAGFPNGRRPGDDVVDIELRVAMGVLCTLNLGGCKPADAPAGALHYTDGAYHQLGVLRQRVSVPARTVEGLAQRRQRDQGARKPAAEKTIARHCVMPRCLHGPVLRA